MVVADGGAPSEDDDEDADAGIVVVTLPRTVTVLRRRRRRAAADADDAPLATTITTERTVTFDGADLVAAAHDGGRAYALSEDGAVRAERGDVVEEIVAPSSKDAKDRWVALTVRDGVCAACSRGRSVTVATTEGGGAATTLTWSNEESDKSNDVGKNHRHLWTGLFDDDDDNDDEKKKCTMIVSALWLDETNATISHRRIVLRKSKSDEEKAFVVKSDVATKTPLSRFADEDDRTTVDPSSVRVLLSSSSARDDRKERPVVLLCAARCNDEEDDVAWYCAPRWDASASSSPRPFRLPVTVAHAAALSDDRTLAVLTREKSSKSDERATTNTLHLLDLEHDGAVIRSADDAPFARAAGLVAFGTDLVTHDGKELAVRSVGLSPKRAPPTLAESLAAAVRNAKRRRANHDDAGAGRQYSWEALYRDDDAAIREDDGDADARKKRRELEAILDEISATDDPAVLVAAYRRLLKDHAAVDDDDDDDQPSPLLPVRAAVRVAVAAADLAVSRAPHDRPLASVLAHLAATRPRAVGPAVAARLRVDDDWLLWRIVLETRAARLSESRAVALWYRATLRTDDDDAVRSYRPTTSETLSAVRARARLARDVSVAILLDDRPVRENEGALRAALHAHRGASSDDVAETRTLLRTLARCLEATATRSAFERASRWTRAVLDVRGSAAVADPRDPTWRRLRRVVRRAATVNKEVSGLRTCLQLVRESQRKDDGGRGGGGARGGTHHDERGGAAEGGESLGAPAYSVERLLF